MKEFVIFVWLLLIIPCQADIITVDDDGPADYDTIQDAINASVDGDVVLVARGQYQECLQIDGKDITLTSDYINTGDDNDILHTIIDGNNLAAVLEIRNTTSAAVVMGLTLQNASDGISPRSKFSLLHSRIVGCADGIDYESGGGGVCRFNVFEDNGDDGIDLDNDVDILIADNSIIGNHDDGIEVRLRPHNGPLQTYIIKNNTIANNKEDGIQLIDYEGISDRVFYIENNIIAGTVKAAIGCMSNGNSVENYEAASIPEPVHVINNTFFDNNYGITGGDNMTVKNNIFANTKKTAVKQVDGLSYLAYNAFWQNGVNLDGTVSGPGNIYQDPMYADPNNADYHLKSQAGRFDPNILSWVQDADTSPCIDAGDPNTPLGYELFPNGGVVNMGAYGGTSQASMSLSTAGNKADLNNNGFVDGEDLALLVEMWLVEDILLPGDINRNGLINFSDFAEFAGQWGWEE